MIKAEIVAHSISPQGNELISVLCTFPRIILAEINTHRMLSKNTSSSRAIPLKKMIEAVENDPFIPIAWQKEHTGMQGYEYLTGLDYDQCVFEWLEAKDRAVEQAEKFKEIKVTKQLVNRLLEPFMWTTMLITGSKEGWDNFFELRCPQYQTPVSQTVEPQKSWKDLINVHGNEQNIDHLYHHETDVIFKLQHNKGQAEIHMMALAEKIYDAMNESTPKQLQSGQWHVPFENKIDLINWLDEVNDDGHLDGDLDEQDRLFEIDKVKISTAMAAHTSYTIVGGKPVKSYKKWIELHDKLVSYNPPHSSPMEHCARAMSDEEYYTFITGNFNQEIEIDADGFIDISTHSNNSNSFGWCNNLKGFIPYRYLLETEGLRF